MKIPVFRLLVFASLIVCVLGGTHTWAHIDDYPNIELSHECSIAGYLERESLTLKGSFYNCSEPPGPPDMNCTVSPNDTLTHDVLNVHCVAPSNHPLFHNRKICSYRFFSRKTVCVNNLYGCYKMAFTCWPVFAPKLEFYFGVALLLIVLISLTSGLCAAGRCWYVKRFRVGKYDLKETQQQQNLFEDRSGRVILEL